MFKRIGFFFLMTYSVLLSSCNSGYNGPRHSVKTIYFSSYEEMVEFSYSEYNEKNDEKIAFVNTNSLTENENKLYRLEGVDTCASHEDEPTNHYISPFPEGFNERGFLPFKYQYLSGDANVIYRLYFEPAPKTVIKRENVTWDLENQGRVENFDSEEERLQYSLMMNGDVLFILQIKGVPNSYSPDYNKELVDEVMGKISVFIDTIKEMYLRIYEVATSDTNLRSETPLL